MKRINIVIVCIIYIISCGFITSRERAASFVKQGNKEYKTGNYQKAIEFYNQALTLDSKNKNINFNIGNSYYKMKEYEKAASFYEKSDKNAKTLFNLGNSYFNEKEGKPVDKQIELCNKSVESYKSAMKFDSKNIQIKKNYEIAVKKSEELKNQKDNKDNKDNQNKDNQNKDNQNKDNQNKDNQNKDNQNNNKNGKQQENQNEQQKQQNKPQNKSGEKSGADNKMSEEERKKEEAKAVLNILQQGEKEDLKNNRMRYVIPNYNGKDW